MRNVARLRAGEIHTSENKMRLLLSSIKCSRTYFSLWLAVVFSVPPFSEKKRTRSFCRCISARLGILCVSLWRNNKTAAKVLQARKQQNRGADTGSRIGGNDAE